MYIYSIRHGESTNNIHEGDADYLIKRTHEPSLTLRGRQQAKAAAHYLYDTFTRLHPDVSPVIYSSYMHRAVQTAEALAEAFNTTILGWRDLYEQGGCVEFLREREFVASHPGSGLSYYRNHHPRLQPDHLLTEHGWNELRNRESQRGCWLRAKRVLTELDSRHPCGSHPIILVSHRMFIGALQTVVLGGSHKHTARINTHNSGISCIRRREKEFYLEFHNQYNFLPPELRNEAQI